MMSWASKNAKIQSVCLHQVDCYKNTRPFKEIMLFVWLTEKPPGPSLPREKRMWLKICEPSTMALVELNGCAYNIRPRELKCRFVDLKNQGTATNLVDDDDDDDDDDGGGDDDDDDEDQVEFFIPKTDRPAFGSFPIPKTGYGAIPVLRKPSRTFVSELWWSLWWSSHSFQYLANHGQECAGDPPPPQKKKKRFSPIQGTKNGERVVFLVETHEDDVPFVWFLPSRLGPFSVMISGWRCADVGGRL